MKKIFKILLVIVMIGSLFGCSSSKDTYQDGNYISSAQGYGGAVTVEVAVASGKITDVVISGDAETPSIGIAAFDTLSKSAIEKQSSDIDAVSGATITSNAVKIALENCLNQALGKTPVTVTANLKDGVYTASAWSFATNLPLTVEVTVADNKFVDIKVIETGDTEIILNTAIENLIPAMIENQSVKLDSIAGATVSSAAIKAATEDCLAQSLAENGSDAGQIAAFYIASEKSTEEVKLETDILVVGLGGAGITTATRAAELIYEANGKDASAVSILGIDKAAKYGGTSVTTTSPMTINPSYFVEKNNGEDFVDAAELKAAWMEYTEGDAQEWAIDVMMEDSGTAVDWLIEKGFVFGAPAQGLSDPYKVCANYGDTFAVSKTVVQGYFDNIMDTFVEMGGEYMLQVEATDLIMDGNDVVGVKAIGSDGTKYEIMANSVVLSTGGFAGNGEMQDKYLSDEYYDLAGGGLYNTYGMTQNDGKMIQSAIDNGASTYNIGMPPVSHIGGAYKIMHEYDVVELDYIDVWTGRNATQSLNDIPMMLAVAPDSLAVNRKGERFTDETALTYYSNWQSGAYYYTIWSNEQIKDIQENGLNFSNVGLFISQGGWPADVAIPEIYDILETGIKMDYIYKADTLEELAQLIGVDAKTLTNTVSEYNAYCDDRTAIPSNGIEKSDTIYGIDGSAVVGDYETFVKVEGDGPYYAVKGSPWIYSTTGALNINESFQVLNNKNEPITGLYAAGTDCLGMLFTEKKEYVTYGGADQGWAFTSGYLLGEVLAQTAK